MPPLKKLKILFVSSEVFPFVKTGGLADVSAALPQMLSEMGHEVRIVVPKYGAVDDRKFKIHEVVRLKDIPLKIGNKETLFSIKSCFLTGQKTKVQIYFLDSPEYFGLRNSMYDDPISGDPYPDNDERFILLSRSVFELVSKLGWVPDIIHSNDWQCGLVPAYLKTLYNSDPQFQNIKSLYTIHNMSFQGIYPASTFSKTGLPDQINSEKGILYNGKLNFMKAGLVYADAINTVSERYAAEVCKDDDVGAGLKTVLSKRKSDLFGIINGIDVNVWNPEKDKSIPKKYSLKTLEKRVENKEFLAQKFGFEFNEGTPIIGIITRLLDNKGIDLIKESFPELMKMDLQVVLLGTGEKKYHKFFEQMTKKYAGKFGCYLGFNNELAHLIEAGADIYLMPSKIEPCGLNQMYSLVYGAVPIVRETGGLADTVTRFNEKTGEGNGFSFKEYSSDAMLKEIKRAVKIFADKKTWQKIMKTGMKSDFSWHSSAKKYVDLYKTILNN